MPKPRQRYALWLTGQILKILGALLIFAVICTIIWRVFISNIPPKEMKQLQPTPQLAAAYAEHGEALRLYTQEQPSVTKAESNYGYFGISRYTFIPQAKQLQIVFRYNNSTLRHLQEDYALADRPAPGDPTLFDLTLVTVTDLTPENAEDNGEGSDTLQKERVHPTSYQVDTTALYTYVLFVFDEIEVSDAVTAIFLDVYYREDIQYERAAYGTLLLYNSASPDIGVKLSRKERKALEGFLSDNTP
ncbi:MAG: DUF3313 domain-containing protein [Ruminococcaceae bacterium]|nr:DUF3313 domain-containing protein [Oscillospiraceae bacterium]